MDEGRAGVADAGSMVRLDASADVGWLNESNGAFAFCQPQRRLAVPWFIESPLALPGKEKFEGANAPELYGTGEPCPSTMAGPVAWVTTHGAGAPGSILMLKFAGAAWASA